MGDLGEKRAAAEEITSEAFGSNNQTAAEPASVGKAVEIAYTSMSKGTAEEDRKHMSIFKSPRKFHDKWAAFLFAIMFTVLVTLAVLTLAADPGRNIQTQDKENSSNKPDFKFLALISALSLLSTTAAVVALFSLCNFIPKATIYASFLLLLLWEMVCGSLGGAQGLAVVALLIIVQLVVFFYAIKPHVGYIAKCMSKASSIIAKYGGMMVLISLHPVLLCAAINILAFIALRNSTDGMSFFFILSLFCSFWSFFVAPYYLQVFVTSVVVSHIYADGAGQKEILYTALDHTFHATGSVCFEAAIAAIVKTARTSLRTLRTMAEQGNGHSRRNDSMRALILLLLSLIIIMVYMLEFFVEFMNSIVFSYIAVYGSSYSESVQSSYLLAIEKKAHGLSSLAGVDIVSTVFTTLLGLFLCFITGLETRFFYGVYLLDAEVLRPYIYTAAHPILLCCVLFWMIASMISSGVLGLVFCKIEFATSLKKYDPDLDSIMEETNLKLLKQTEFETVPDTTA